MPDVPPGPRPSTLYFSKIIIGALIVIAVFKLTDRLSRRADPLPTPPTPNAYETLLTVSREVTLPPGDLADLRPLIVSATAESNRVAIARVHEALRQKIAVPLSTGSRWSEAHAKDLKALKRLAGALALQARADMLAGKTNESAAHLVDIILLGQALARGGVINDGINSMVIETVGTASVRSQLEHLDGDFCRSAAQELEGFEGRREPAQAIFKTDKAWSIRTFGLVGRIGDRFLQKPRTEREAEFTRRYNSTIKRTRTLILLLAARAVELESGSKVTDIEGVVPAVLKAAPIDPETNTRLVLTPI